MKRMRGLLMVRFARASRPAVCILVIYVFAMMGCSGGDRLNTAPVTGTVTYDGKPLAEATVNFMPEQGPSAKGETGADGSFTLSTYAVGDGAVVGQHKIGVIAVDPEDKKAFQADPKQIIPKWRIPMRYANPEVSGLRFEVKSGVDNVVNLELSK